GNRSASIHYYWEAARLFASTPLAWVGALGLLVSLIRGQWWPVVFGLLVPVFYVVSLHSGTADLYVPTLWPVTYYNLRSAPPAFLALSVAAAAWIPPKWPIAAGIVILMAGASCFSPPICFEEARVNSQGRRQAQQEAARFLRSNYQRGS